MQNNSVTRSKVALRSVNGYYVCAENGGGIEVNVTRKDRKTWETFELIEFPQTNKVALLACDGHYVCAENGGGGKVVADRDKLLDWETFELINLQEKPTVKVALRAHGGQYLCAEIGGGHELTATRPKVGPYETFELITLGEKFTVQLSNSPLAKKVSKAPTETEEVGAYLCTNTLQDFNFSPSATDRFVASSVMSDILWPGSILDAATIPTGEYSPIIAERAPLTLSHTIPGMSANITLASATLSGFREAFSKLLSSMDPAKKPVDVDFHKELLYSENQLSVVLGGHYKKSSLEISASLDLSASSTKSKLLVAVSHIYFSLDVSPDLPGSYFFADRQRTIGENEIYIATVVYGRRFRFFMESAEEGFALEAAANVATAQGGGDVDFKSKSLLRDAKISIWVEGGMGNGAMPIEGDGDEKVEVIRSYTSKDAATLGPGKQVAPLFYKMRTVRDPHPINFLSLTTKVNVRTCVKVTGTFRVVDGKITRGTGTGREYYGTIVAQAFDDEGVPNDADKDIKPVWNLSKGQHVSLDKGKWVQAGCARQEFTWKKTLKDVKGTAYIEFSGTAYEWDKRSASEKLTSSSNKIYLDKTFPQTMKMHFTGRRTAPFEFECTVEALSEE